METFQTTSLYKSNLMTETAISKMKIVQAVGPCGIVLEMIKITFRNFVLE